MSRKPFEPLVLSNQYDEQIANAAIAQDKAHASGVVADWVKRFEDVEQQRDQLRAERDKLAEENEKLRAELRQARVGRRDKP